MFPQTFAILPDYSPSPKSLTGTTQHLTAIMSGTKKTEDKKKSSVSSKDGTNFKRSRDDLDETDDRIQSFDELLTRMKQMFDDTNTRIDTCKSDLQAEFTTLRENVQSFKDRCSVEINNLSDALALTQNNVNLNHERHLKNSKSNDLLLSGVPYHQPEDLLGFVKSASAALGYGERELPLIYTKRLARPPIAPGSTPPILLQFAFRAARDDFYFRYLSSHNLSLTHLGFNVNKRVYLNENLTDQARSIKGAALKLKKSGKLHSVYTKDGFIFVKPAEGGEAKLVNSLEQLAE